MIIEQSISIGMPREAVFDYLQDFNNRTEFVNYMDEVRLVTEKKEGLGVQYAEIATVFGKKFETVYEVVEFEEDRHIKVRSVDAVFNITSSIDLDLSSIGTRLELRIEIDLPGVMKFGAPLVKGFIDSEARRILKTIKTNVESKGSMVN